ncbi:hypothetical protein STRDD10_01223 [Streptococcus sp. DD10]|uniref:DUF960 domain-containing protein n=1 Tax=Streptococcus sp. DD10 TaxID=1777878 RepID=UPI0007966A00|nr:DUF960 domain-containing protein [Streptococcus sp. DD10]KXT74065.1 hypothetical protein STRDD10_01223 [Streptococcus sp. DD10]
MAFTNTRGRYASFGVAASLSSEVIDDIWYVIDNFLKGVFPLQHCIRFEILNNHGTVSLRFSQEQMQTSIGFDFSQHFDPFYPMEVYVVDRQGRETVLLPDEYEMF